MPRRLRRSRPTAHASAPSSFQTSQGEAGTTLCVGLSRSSPSPIRIIPTSRRLARRTVGVIACRRAFRPAQGHGTRFGSNSPAATSAPRRAIASAGRRFAKRRSAVAAGTLGSPRCASSCAMRRCTVDWLVLALVYDLVACTHSSLKMAASKHTPGQPVAPLPHSISLNKLKRRP